MRRISRSTGTGCYLYRALDREGHRVEAPLGETRHMAAARRFFARALAIAGRPPDQVTTDGHDADPRANREALGAEARHRTSRYKNKRSAQDHRGVQHRSYPLRGFGAFAAAARCGAGVAEQRQYFRPVARSGEAGSLADRRRVSQERRATIRAELAAA